MKLGGRCVKLITTIKTYTAIDIKVLSKYSKSKLNGSLIKDMYVYLNGVIVNAENGSQKVFLFDTEGKNLCDYDADYIICEIQGDVDIEVSK